MTMTETILLVILATVLAIDLAVASYVLVQNPKNVVNQSFFAIVAGIVVWGTGFLLSRLQAPSSLYVHLIMYGGMTFIASFAAFSRVVPHGARPSRGIWPLLVPMALAAALMPSGLIIKDAALVGGVVSPTNGPLFPAFAFVCLFYIAYGIYALRSTFRASSIADQKRFKYFFLGFGFFMLIVLVFDVLLPAWGIFFLNILGPFSSIVLVIATAYAVARHSILDIKFVIQRGIIYTVLLVFLIGTYLLLVLMLGSVFHVAGSRAAFFGGGIAAVIGALGVKPLESYFRKITDRWFFKDRYDYGEALHGLSRIVNTNVSQSLIIQRSEEALAKIFKAQNVSILLGSVIPPRLTAPTLRRAEVCVPLVFEDTRIGMLIVGRKRSGDDYDGQDIRLIETFSYQAAVALEKARLYEEVKERSLNLEQLVEERTRTIKELMEDQKQSMFDISHSLQTPLAVLTNQIELLEETSADAHILSVCKHSIRSVSQFIRRLLHLVTLESKYSNDVLVPIDISAVLEGDGEYFATMAEVEGIVLSVQTEPGLVINGNSELVDELVMNLVTNAIKYSDKKKESRTVSVSLTRKGNRAVLRVEDNGVGIPATDHEAIFKRFYRARQRDTSAQGSGLGLAICKRIADMHKAHISLHSVPGEGSAFTVSFPIVLDN